MNSVEVLKSYTEMERLNSERYNGLNIEFLKGGALSISKLDGYSEDHIYFYPDQVKELKTFLNKDALLWKTKLDRLEKWLEERVIYLYEDSHLECQSELIDLIEEVVGVLKE